jgi:TatD DNase family protein
MMIDTHAHLYDAKIISDLSLIMQNAVENGVRTVLMPNVDCETVEKMHFVEEQYPHMTKSMMGLHPCHVGSDWKNDLRKLSANFQNHKYTGIGETGIDLYWDKTYYDEQVKSFEWQIDQALEMNLPVIIHSRESTDVCIDIISKKQKGDLKGVFHCFSGDEAQAAIIKDLQFLIGIGGVVTYKNSNLGKILQKNSLDNVVLETDSPYLAPVPHRGKLNQPGFLKLICEKIAIELGITTEEVQTKTTQNAIELFGLTD